MALITSSQPAHVQHVSVWWCDERNKMSHIAPYQNQHEQFVIVYSTLGEDQDKNSTVRIHSEYIIITSHNQSSQDNQVHVTLTCTHCSIHCRLCLRRRVITKNISNSCLLLINDKQNKLTVQPPNFLPAPTLSPPAQTNSFASDALSSW